MQTKNDIAGVVVRSRRLARVADWRLRPRSLGVWHQPSPIRSAFVECDHMSAREELAHGLILEESRYPPALSEKAAAWALRPRTVPPTMLWMVERPTLYSLPRPVRMSPASAILRANRSNFVVVSTTCRSATTAAAEVTAASALSESTRFLRVVLENPRSMKIRSAGLPRVSVSVHRRAPARPGS